MGRQSFRSRCFAGVAALSAVGAALAVGGARPIPMGGETRPAALVAARQADPEAALKRPVSETLTMTHDPYSHLVRLAGLFSDSDGDVGDEQSGSLSLDRPLHATDVGTTGVDRAGVTADAIHLSRRLDGGFVNLTIGLDAVYDAPRRGN